MAVVVDVPANTGTTTATTVTVRPSFNFDFFKTPHGLSLLAQFIISIIIFVINSNVFVSIVSWIAWIITHLLCWIYLFSLNERYTSNPPFKVVEFYFHGGATLLYAIGTIICFISLAWITGVFVILNTIAYAAAAWFLFPEWQNYRAGGGATPK